MINRTIIYSITLSISLFSCKADKFDQYRAFPIMGGSIVINQDILDIITIDNVPQFNEYRESTSPQMKTIIWGYNQKVITVYSNDATYYSEDKRPLLGFNDLRGVIYDELGGHTIFSSSQIPFNEVVDTIIGKRHFAYFARDNYIFLSQTVSNKIIVTIEFCNFQDTCSLEELVNSYYFAIP